MIVWIRRTCMALTVLTAASAAVHAEVSRIEITSRSDVLGGKNWGTRGPYEKLSGTVTFTVDPQNSFDKSIPNIDKAPRDAQGKVEFSSDFFIPCAQGSQQGQWRGVFRGYQSRPSQPPRRL